MANAGTVTLNLDADSIKLIRELDKASRKTKRTASQMGKDMGRAFKQIAAGAAVMGVAMIAATKVSVEFGDKIGKTSKAVGLTAEQFQEFSFAAGRAGVNISLFSSGMTAFVKRVGEAQTSFKGPLVTGLKDFNMELLNNIKNSPNQAAAFKALADGVKNAGSATEQAAIANAAFGRSGITLVNMLRDGSAGLETMAEKAQSLGVVLSDELIAKSEDAADKFGDLQQVMKVSIAAAVLENADSIITLANSLITLVGAAGKATKGWSDWMSSQGVGLNSVEAIRVRGDVLMRDRIMYEKELQKLQAYPTNNLQEIERLQSKINNIIKEQIDLQDQAIALQKENKPTVAAVTATAQSVVDPNATKDQADKIVDIIKGMMNDIKQFGMTDDQKALINLIDKGATEADIALFTQATNEMRLLTETQEAAKDAAKERNELEQEYADLLAGTVTATQLHELAVARVKELYAMGIIPNAEEYLLILESINDQFAASQQKAGETTSEMTEFSKQAARNMQTAFADFLFDPMEEGFDGMVRGFAKALQRMAADLAAAQIMNAIMAGIGGAMGGSTESQVGALIDGTFAAGGYVPSNGTYLVGERGPEILQMGNTSGNIIPNHELGGSGTVNVSIDAREQDDPAKILSLVPLITSQVEQSIALKMKRGYF